MITLQFTTENSVGSSVIRWFSHSDFSHVDIVNSMGKLIGARSDTKTPGVAIREPGYVHFTKTVQVELEGTPNWEWLNKQIGKPYDKTGLFRSFLFSDHSWGHDNSWWCSELGLAFLENSGFPKASTPANRFTPNDLYIFTSAFKPRYIVW